MKKFLLMFCALFAMTFFAKAQVPVLTEDFEGGSIPSGWTTIDANNDGFGWEHSSVQEDIEGHNSTGSIVSYSYDNGAYAALTPDNWLISPAITLSGTSSLSFWFVVAQSYPADHFGVYISTTSATDTTAFTSIFDYTPTSANGNWTQQTIDLTSYAGNTVYIAFRHFDCTDQFILALDDIVVYSGTTETVLTVNPASINFGMVSPNEHSAVASVLVTGYNTTSTISATVNSPFEVSNDNTYFGTTTTLPAAGDTLYVRYSPTTEGTDNGTVTLTSGTATASVTLTGTAVNCNVTLPYTETFETTSPYLGCWTMSGDGTWSIGTGDYSSSTGAYEGTYNAVITHSASGNVTKLISPFIVGADNGLALTFAYVMRSWAGDTDELRVYSRSDANSAWQQVAEYTDATTTWTLETVYISGAVYQIAFEMTDHYGYGVGLDNVSFSPTSTDFCYPVTNLTASNVTAHEATLTWSGNANSYTIYNLTDSSTVATVNDTTYNLTNLTSDFQHSFGVVANCTSSNSDMVIVNFRTQISCPVPTGLAIVLTPGNGTVATLNWNENGTASAWQICLNGDETNLIDANDTTYNFTNLTPEQAYTVKVRAYCDANDQSAWSNTITFTPTNAYFVTVNDGTTTNSYVPIYGLYVDEITRSQFIIPATDLTAMLYGSISKLTFYCSSADVDWGAATFNVYVTETNDTTLSALADFSTMTQVYAGSLSIVNHTMEVSFTSPYFYMGGNLMIGFDQTLEGDYESSYWYGVTANGASIGGRSVSLSQRNFLPKTTISYTPGTAPSCLPVNDLTVDTATSTSVTISWTGTAASYDIYNDNTLVGNTTSNTYTITGLAAATAYTFGVQAVCSATDVSIMRTVSTTTECGIIDVFPYVQDFNTSPSCWTIIDADGDGNNWYLYQGAVQSASYSSIVLTPDNWLISPQFAIPASGNLEVTWTATAQDQSWPAEHYGVFVSTTGNTNTSDFTMLQEWTLSTGVFNPTIDLSAYAGQNIYIALRHFNCTNQFRISIDDFIVREQAGANQVTINVSQNNPAYGTVAGAGIYNIGDSVTVSATAATGYTFGKWVDENNIIISTENPYTFVAATDLTLQAIFLDAAGNSYTITVEVNDSIMGTATGGGTYTAGDQITLTATANAGYHFVNWTQISSFGENEVGTDPELIITVTASKTFKANFEADSASQTLTIHLTINDPTLGTVTPEPGDYVVTLNETLMITATPNDGVTFDGYRVLWNGQIIINVPAAVNPFPCNVSSELFNLGEITVMALFSDGSSAPDSLTLIVNTDDATMGTTNPVPGTYNYAVGDTSILSAIPNDGYHFLYWIETVSVAGMTLSDTLYTQTLTTIINQMMANMTLTITAYFEANEPGVNYYTVTVNSGNPTMGTVSSTHSGQVAENTEVTVTAIPATNYQFVKWVDEHGNEINTANPYTFIVTEDINLIATFERIDGINNIDASNVLIYANNSSIYVRGAEGHDVFVYDMNGRCIYQHADVNETETINMSSAGIYLVRIDNAIFKKVVIVK